MSRSHCSVQSIAAAAALAVATLLSPGVPAAANEPVATPGPGVCNERIIMLDEGEALEERTLYFHGTERLGNLDGNQDAQLGGPPRLFMDGTAPTSADDRVYAARPSGVIGNPASNRNPVQGYWRRLLEAPERIVCAEAHVFAGTANGQLTVQLWVDQPRGTAGAVTGSGTATAPANQVSEYAVNFGALDVTAHEDLVVQLDTGPPGALAFYDSSARPSQLRYVAVVTAQ